MRLKMCSNPKVDEGGQQPIADDRYEGSNTNEFFSLGVYLYSYSRIWVRVSTRKLNNSSHSSSVNPSWSAKFKDITNRPQFTFEKTSEWSSFNFSSRSFKFLFKLLYLTWIHFQFCCFCFGLRTIQRKVNSRQRQRKPQHKQTPTQNLVIFPSQIHDYNWLIQLYAFSLNYFTEKLI